MNSLCKPKRTPDFTVSNYGGDPCWEFFMEEKLQYNIVQDSIHHIRVLSEDNTLEWFNIPGDYWCKYGSMRSTINVTYIRYLEEVANKILLEYE